MVFFDRFISLFIAWITVEMKSLQLIGLTYNVFNGLCFHRIKNISWHDTYNIYFPKKTGLWCALLTDYINIRLLRL